MNTKAKRIIKILFFGSAIAISILVIISVIGFSILTYEFKLKITNVGTEYSPDGRYSVCLQSVGEPFGFGNAQAKAIVLEGKKVVKKYKTYISDDGGQFGKDSYSVDWKQDEVIITFHGCEQKDEVVLISLK